MFPSVESPCSLHGGLSTKQAVYRLYKDIKDYLNEIQPHLHDTHSWKHILRQAYSRKSIYSTFRWTSILFLLISIIIYIFACKYGHFTSSLPLTIESIILTLVLILNTGIIFWNSRSRHLEIFNKALKLANKIYECSNNEELLNHWSSGIFYPNLNTPTSPCISLQWTYRDGKLINLPQALLVAGDVILLNPGRPVPANCRRIDKVVRRPKKLSDFSFSEDDDQTDLDHIFTYIFYGTDSMRDCTLLRGETFNPKVDHVPETFTLPRLRKAVKPYKFLVLETPFINDLKTAMCHHTNRRSPTAFEKELQLIFVRYLEHMLVPIIFFLVFIFSIIHYCYVEVTGSHFDTGPATIVLIFLRPIMAIIPLLPLALPLVWLLLNVYGLIKLDVIYENFCKNQDRLHVIFNRSDKSTEQINECEMMINDIENKRRDLFLDEIDPERFDIPTRGFKLKRILKEFFLFFYNDNGNLWRTANLLHVLGSITALCCVDKKGILSWPNPTADKVFFLTTPSQEKRRRNTFECGNSEDHSHEPKTKSHPDKRNSVFTNATKAECVQLDITHDHHNAQYGLQFDDIYWSRYLPNLKPLGLAILLNTCNKATQEEFVQFSDHIACESLNNEVAVPVVNKRCLCELARQIGFKQNAIRGYEYCYQVGLFRHIRPEVIQKGKLAKSLNFPRLKMPFPNMTCAVIKDVFSNTSQLFSQGTGDLILDACAEYWNGQSLVLLTDYEKKKILDFYQRSSLTSYCCAFSYLPLINETAVPYSYSHNDFYIELPPDSSHLFPSQRSLDCSIRGLESHYSNASHNLDTNCLSQNANFLNPDAKLGGHHLSSDSLGKADQYTDQTVHLHEEDDPHRQRTKSMSQDSQKLEETMKKVINEVFIGMTTLQYQACSDFVRLIELLEAACIRFVHFSKENELRSRVFSEKMGLESGWNCHISLLNDCELPSGEAESISDNSDFKKINEALVQNKTYKAQHRGSITSSSSIGSLIDNKGNLSDSDDELRIHRDLEEGVKCQHKRKHNSFSVSSERSGSVISSTRYTRNFRASSKNSGSHSGNNPHRGLSPSPTTTSTMTEHSAPIGFDMSNRAKLPKGIDNIRPHLENVDNVPLLVSLFTDCTPNATKEMIKIMQEYEEVVCVLGSMANESNIPIFLQADASIGVDPMYPHACITEPIHPADQYSLEGLPENFLTPIDIANQLIALPCSLTMSRQNSIIFYQLIMNSRDYMMRMRNVFQFFLSSCLSLSLAQMITSLFFLPPLLSPGIVLWLSLVVIPFLSVALMGSQYDPGVMNVATGKKLHLNKETIAYFFVCYVIKFTPSIIICVIMFAIIIGTSCGQTKVGRSTLGPCWMFSDVKANGDIKTDLIWSSQLLIAQTIASFFLVLYLVIISIGFVYRNHLLWQRSPVKNISWVTTSIVLMILHICVCMLEIYIYVPEAEITHHFINIIPYYIWIIAFVWPILLVTINVFTKRHEIRMYSRQQRRARLEFGTKLGMNSPF